jgi:arginine-tRNA-protein transferase
MTPIDSGSLELRDDEGALIACCLVDRSSDGLSAVYSFFDPDRSADSLGSFIVLRLIEEARRARLAPVYLGYWIAASRKMAYRSASSRWRPSAPRAGRSWTGPKWE